ncbi:MAG: DUF1835 domain-containing protein [Gammaproteobacteria bacterium]|nr:DUF1835 domain-containing protein [Gammaproteobacteria bacterium]
MKNILNITNGDSAVEIMKQANIPGVFLPWQDVLHDGPVPENLTLEELSKIRANFIINQDWGSPENIKKSFIERDNELKSFSKYEKVILWFEHDLYDQLQILQILDWFHFHSTNEFKLSIICTDSYLGMLSPDEMKDIMKYETTVTQSHLTLSSQAWSAFRSSSPEKWYELLNTDTSALPFLGDAIVRMLEEFPNCSNGLSRTAQQALTIISEGETHPGKVFRRYQETEERMFLGDASFWKILQELIDATSPLLHLSGGKTLNFPIHPDQKLTITPLGIDVLSDKTNWLDRVELERWIGGTHLRTGNIWCWNPHSALLSKKT